MEFVPLPFGLRILVVVCLAVGVVAWDWRRHPQQPTRLYEYSFLLGCGVVGAAFGVVNDLITSSISLDYFVLGKGLAGGEGFRDRVMSLGAQAGFGAGIIGARLTCSTALHSFRLHASST